MGIKDGQKLSQVSLLAVDGEALTEARIKAGLSLQVVAERLGCNKGSVSRWEQGSLCPTLQRMQALVEMYGTWKFIRLNERVVLRPEDVEAVKKIFDRDDVVVADGIDGSKYLPQKDVRRFYNTVGPRDYFQMRLNSKIELTPETIEALRKLMEG